jgi:hypothetical protein
MSTTPAATKTAAKQEPNSGHDSQGQFTKGNKGGPGNPFARQVAWLRASLVNSGTREEVISVGKVLHEKALGGDVHAIKLYFQYMLGKPAETVDPDRLAFDEWRKLKEQAVAPVQTQDIVQQCPAEVACELVKLQWPAELERNLREGAEESARVEAEVQEDERYMAEQEAAEEEALKQKRESVARRQKETASPAGDDHSAARQEARTAVPTGAARQSKPPSPKPADGASVEVENAPDHPGPGERLIRALSRRLSQRLDPEKAMALGSPSPNGDQTATDTHK